MTMNKYLVCIVGPTGIGKTALSLDIAKHFQTEIISADSRQFYKEMSIGTAVPHADELKAVVHHFIQHISIHDDYSVGFFERDAISKIDSLFKDHHVLVMVGGSGLFVKAICEGLDDLPKVDPKIRQQLNEIWKREGLDGHKAELAQLDPETYNSIDIDNPHRIIRALEITKGTGRPFSSFLTGQSTERPFNTVYIGIKAERELMYERINKRVDSMMEAGLLEEAKALFGYRHLKALNTVGYKELFKYFQGDDDLDHAVSEIKKNSRRYAKRQMTWFKKQGNLKWFDYKIPADEIIAFLQTQIK